jgi:hypothetical protein
VYVVSVEQANVYQVVIISDGMQSMVDTRQSEETATAGMPRVAAIVVAQPWHHRIR